ncbi:unnamed protein product [Didymodactylos carnosus]|uniref:Fas-binding factor 1 C-terminal domain-containing protein n=1 Tax=Didymodactylos carnosus TaxID=1234261 RepID=A0A8S2P4L6_9BILA|nr:unnamed protein product [Didymodactylos carnosus]CAF4030186.1 unnamed protein product [Didymodactylos carnosus]
MDTKKSLPLTITKRSIDDGDDEDGLNRTGGGTGYSPSFGGFTNTSGTNTLQRILDQPRPATASGSKKYDDPFGSLFDEKDGSKNLGDTDKSQSKKTVRFDDFDDLDLLTRPSTAPSQSLNQGKSVLSMLRTGLEPKSFETFSSTKSGNINEDMTASLKPHAYLGLTDNNVYDDDNDDDREPQYHSKQEELRNPLSELISSVPLVKQKTELTSLPPKKSVIETNVPVTNTMSRLDQMLETLDKKDLEEKPVARRITADGEQWNWGNKFQETKSNSVSTSLEIQKQPIKEKNIVGNRKIDMESNLFETKVSDINNKPFTMDTSKDEMFKTVRFMKTTIEGYSYLSLKKLEFENNELKMTIDHIKRQHETEMSMLEENYKNRLEYVEKSCERRENRYKEENEHLMRQLNDRTRQFETEKTTLTLEHQKRLEDLQRDRTMELENLRTLQRQAIDHLRKEHEQTLQRLRQLKEEEISTAMDVTSHTRAFESVVGHMEQNAKHIDELRLKLDTKHTSVLSEKEQQLKAYDDRLQKQAHDFERERKNLQELISRLEVHLSEQTRLVEEERWKALQAQKRMEAMQDSLTGEQRLFTEKLQRERLEIQRAKDQLLDEQKTALTHLYDSKTQIAEDRARLDAMQKAFNEQKHKDMIQNATIEAEMRSNQRAISEQISRLDKRENELQHREESLQLERRSILELKQQVDNDRKELTHLRSELQQKTVDTEQLNQHIEKEREHLSKLLIETQTIDGKNNGKLQQLQMSIRDLRQKEEIINEQYARLTTERNALNQLRSSVPLKRQSPIIDSGFSTMHLSTRSSIQPQQQQHPYSIDESSLLRTLRLHAVQDQMYIDDELSFIGSLRGGYPHLNHSRSLSNLNRNPEFSLLKTNR